MRAASSLRAAAQDELPIVTNPVVLEIGGHTEPYDKVVLQPTDKRANGRAVWSTLGSAELHLYSDASGNWCLSGKYTPETTAVTSNSNVACFESNSAVPPAGKHNEREEAWKWKLHERMRVAGRRKGWADGELTLLCGDEGKARVVRGLTQHTRMSASVICFRQCVQVGSCRTRGEQQSRLNLSWRVFTDPLPLACPTGRACSQAPSRAASRQARQIRVPRGGAAPDDN